MQQDIEQRRKRIELLVKLAAFPMIGFLIAPFMLIAVKGLIGLILTSVIGLTAVNFAPWFGMKLANWRLKAIKSEAAANPIETLENQYQERENALLKFREDIKLFHAEVENFYGELEEHRRLYPADATKFETQYGKMKALLASRADKYKQVQANLQAFAELIERKRSEWNVAQAAARMTKAANVGEDFLSKLKEDTALTSISTNLNAAFAELEVSLLDAAVNVVPITTAETHAIADKSGPPALDLDFVNQNQKERRAAK